MKKYQSVGLMSGTSLDGLDLVWCEFWKDTQWKFNILKSQTRAYPPEWLIRLKQVEDLSARELKILDNDLGNFFGEAVHSFLNPDEHIDFIASHGHTVFHDPGNNYTFQIGNGANIYAKTGIKTICDFRSVDVALNGQGAPLVPIGDQLLFPEYDACLNLGGFSNISFQKEEVRFAFDICPVNLALNHFAEIFYQMSYDDNGEFGKLGKADAAVLNQLNQLDYYSAHAPKSLGKEWLMKFFIPILREIKNGNDVFATLYEHMAEQIAHVFKKYDLKNVMITGGGAYNSYLIRLIKSKSKTQIIIPDNEIVEFKEALIFSFLGLLRIQNIPNCLSSVTGANVDNIGGAIYG